MSDPIIPIDNATVWDQLDEQNKVIDEMKSERDTLRARVAELEAKCAQLKSSLNDKAMEMCGSLPFVKLYQETVAQAAAQRSALLAFTNSYDHDCAEDYERTLTNLEKAFDQAAEVLSSTAGTELLARMKELEQSAAEMVAVTHFSGCIDGSTLEARNVLDAALKRYRAAMAKGDA